MSGPTTGPEYIKTACVNMRHALNEWDRWGPSIGENDPTASWDELWEVVQMLAVNLDATSSLLLKLAADNEAIAIDASNSDEAGVVLSNLGVTEKGLMWQAATSVMRVYLVRTVKHVSKASTTLFKALERTPHSG